MNFITAVGYPHPADKHKMVSDKLSRCVSWPNALHKN
jgi:hypothetical protein